MRHAKKGQKRSLPHVGPAATPTLRSKVVLSTLPDSKYHAVLLRNSSCGGLRIMIQLHLARLRTSSANLHFADAALVNEPARTSTTDGTHPLQQGTL